MFATLVIQLPSVYTGGEFIVYNGSHVKKYDFGQSTGKAPIAMHFTAHYADLEHEIKPIKSGYRVALVYSLCSNDNIAFNMSESEITSQLSNVLNNLATLDKPLAIALDHQYTHESLSNNGMMALKSIDADRFKLLKSASMSLSTENQLCFYIVKASLESQKMIEDDEDDYYNRYHYEEEENEEDEDEDEDEDRENEARTYECNNEPKDFLTAEDEEAIESEDEYGYQKHKSLTNWYDFDGNPMFENRDNLSVDFFWKIFDLTNGNANKINSWMFEDRQEEYTGNEGNSATTTYNKYLLAFWSKRSKFSVMARVSIKKAIKLIANDSNEQTKAENLENLLNMMNGNTTVFESDEETEYSSDSDEEIESDEDSEDEASFNATDLDCNCFVYITNLVINMNRSKLTKLFLEALSKEQSISIRTNSVYNIWKAGLLDASTFKSELHGLIQIEENEGVEYFVKQVEMLKVLKDIDLANLMIKRAFLFYSTSMFLLPSYRVLLAINSSNTNANNQNKIMYLQKAFELIEYFELQSVSHSFFESTKLATDKDIQENCNLIQVKIFEKIL